MNLPEIAFEDESLIVLNKPSGIIVNIAQSTKEQYTVQHFLREKYSDLFDKNGTSDFHTRNGIVHRLDKDTSGILIIAKNEDIFMKMQTLFHDRKVKKTYLAVVYDQIRDALVGDEFEINAPIARNPSQREKFAVVSTGREALTKFKILKFKKISEIDTTVLECQPFTGRTHQIRVHLTALNHPVVGDVIYAGRTRYKRDIEIFPRLMLHASKLEFKHPITKEKIEFESKLPQDMKTVID